MKKTLPFILIVWFVSAAAAQQPSETPKPGPEYLKMLGWCGEYTITGKTYTTPLGPGGKIQGRLIGRPILDGFAIEGTYLYEGQGPCGETQGKETTSYDPTTQKYYYVYLSNNGYSEQAPFIVEGAVTSWESTRAKGGKQFKLRGTDTDLPDGSGFVRKEEITVDGTTWLPAEEATFLKVKGVEGTGDVQELIRPELDFAGAVLSPEMKKLEFQVGDWAYEGQQVDPPVAGLPYGPAGKYAGTITTRFLLGGRFLGNRVDDTNPSGRTTILSISGYDAKARNYVSSSYLSDGSMETSIGTVTPDGRTWTDQSTITTSQGNKVPVRSVVEYSPDGTHYTGTAEVSPDGGKTWKHWCKEEGRKTKK